MQQLQRDLPAQCTRQSVVSHILLERLQVIIDPQLMEAQCGVRKGQGKWTKSW